MIKKAISGPKNTYTVIDFYLRINVYRTCFVVNNYICFRSTNRSKKYTGKLRENILRNDITTYKVIIISNVFYFCVIWSFEQIPKNKLPNSSFEALVAKYMPKNLKHFK